MRANHFIHAAGDELRVTALGLGGGPLGTFTRPVSEEEAQGTLASAWNAGVRYFDTSPWYGLGLSEHRLGSFLRSKLRREYVISTKVGRVLHPWNDTDGPRLHAGPWQEPLDFEVQFDYSYEGIIRSYEDSLQRLGIAQIDILFVHDLDPSYHNHGHDFEVYMGQLIANGFRALRELRANGTVSAIGVGINSTGLMPKFLELFDVDCFLVAGPFTLLNTEILNTELRQCQDAGVWTVMGSPFHSGILAKGSATTGLADWRYLPDSDASRLRRIEAVCARHGVPVGAAALQFPANHATCRSVLVGASNGPQVEQVALWFDLEIPNEFWQELALNELIPADSPVLLPQQ